MTQRKPTITLTAYNIGTDDEEFWREWVDYVCQNIDEKAGFEVDIDTFRRNYPADEDRIENVTDEQREHLRVVLANLWESFCAE